MRILLSVLLGAVVSLPAHAQLTIGAGAGAGAGNRGGSAKGTHAGMFLELKVPALPGIRGDVLAVDAPRGAGRLSVALGAVMAAPIPVVTPYVLGGWGTYGIGDTSRGGWHVGAGIRARLGVGLYLEYRRHQRIARDLVTVGLIF
jgi:hypothetical protein